MPVLPVCKASYASNAAEEMLICSEINRIHQKTKNILDKVKKVSRQCKLYTQVIPEKIKASVTVIDAQDAFKRTDSMSGAASGLALSILLAIASIVMAAFLLVFPAIVTAAIACGGIACSSYFIHMNRLPNE